MECIRHFSSKLIGQNRWCDQQDPRTYFGRVNILGYDLTTTDVRHFETGMRHNMYFPPLSQAYENTKSKVFGCYGRMSTEPPRKEKNKNIFLQTACPTVAYRL